MLFRSLSLPPSLSESARTAPSRPVSPSEPPLTFELPPLDPSIDIVSRSIDLSIDRSIDLPSYLATDLSIPLPIHQSIHLSIFLFIFNITGIAGHDCRIFSTTVIVNRELSIHPSIYPSIHPSIPPPYPQRNSEPRIVKSETI